MGGYGSTRWEWHTKKKTVEACPRLRVRDFDKSVLARAYERGTAINESDKRPPAVDFDVIVDEAFAAMGIPVKKGIKTPQKPQSYQPFLVDRTPCYLGGYRYWLLCPKCDRRCATVYKRGGRLACRICHDLTYKSVQTAHEHDRGFFFPYNATFYYQEKIDALHKRWFRCHLGSKNWWRYYDRFVKLNAKLAQFSGQGMRDPLAIILGEEGRDAMLAWREENQGG